MKHLLSSALRTRRGATAIEYGLVATLVSVAILVAVLALSGSLDRLFSSVSETVENSVGS